jgi:hypothetical protein
MLASRLARRLIATACATVTLSFATVARADTLVLSDDFNAYPLATWTEGSAHGNFFVDFNGMGIVSIVGNDTNHRINLKPKASTTQFETHAALVTTLNSWGNMDATVQMNTDQQLRTGTAPNPWEVGWFVWHFTDNDHFYYFMLKPNGWELGRRDPAGNGGQIFLATGSSPSITIPATNTIRVRQVGNEIGVYVDGVQVAYYVDQSAGGAYLSGKVGFYTEDARARFDNLSIYTVP